MFSPVLQSSVCSFQVLFILSAMCSVFSCTISVKIGTKIAVDMLMLPTPVAVLYYQYDTFQQSTTYLLPLLVYCHYENASLYDQHAQLLHIPSRQALPMPALPRDSPLPSPPAVAPLALHVGRPCGIHGHRPAAVGVAMGRQLGWTFHGLCSSAEDCWAESVRAQQAPVVRQYTTSTVQQGA